MKRVVVVGGGVTGLTTAFDVREAAAGAGLDVEIVVLEARHRAGGNIRTERTDGYIIEKGPNGFLDNAPRTIELVHRLGLADQLQPADEAAARRFVYRDGRLHEAPTGPLSFLRSPLLSLPGRLRVLGEPFARSRPQGVDESIHDFASRRIGREAASVLVDAMVSGVFAGDAHDLSLQSSFPKMARMEAEHGGLVHAMVAHMKERRSAGPGGTLTSFRMGLDTLVHGLMEALGDGVLRTAAPVVAIEPGDGERPWRVRLADDAAVAADAVVVTIPSPRAAPLLEAADPALAEAAGEIGTAGLAVVATAFDASGIPPVDGFGFLVPRGEDLRILGCLWDSSIFPGRAPEGKVLVRSMIGGAHDPAAVSEDEDVLLGHVRRDLTTAMGIEAEPELTRVYRWPLGIGQYTVGHAARLDRIHDRLRANPGLSLAGSSYYGVSMNACIEKSSEQAREIVGYLGD